MSYLLKKQKILLAVRLSSRKINIKNIISIISLSLEELDNFLLIKEQASDITVKSDNWRGVEIVFFNDRRVGAAKTDHQVNNAACLGKHKQISGK